MQLKHQLTCNMYLQSQGLKNYTSKTYVYMGNTFAEKHNKVIDTINYSYKEVFINGVITNKFYPNFGGNSTREINYLYNDHNELISKTSTVTYHTGQMRKDSIIHIPIDSITTEILTYNNHQQAPQKEIERISNDTTFTDYYNDEKIVYTNFEYWESTNTKISSLLGQDQITKHTYDKYGALIQLDLFKGKEHIETTMQIDQTYDSKNRVTKRVHWAGKEKLLSFIECIIYQE